MHRIVEEERGTDTSRSVHPHNGYYAGDFTSAPVKQPDLRALLALTEKRRDTHTGPRHEPLSGASQGHSTRLAVRRRGGGPGARHTRALDAAPGE